MLRDTGDPLGALPRFDDFRPEFATGGDHIYSELRWLATDTLGLTGELTHDLETNRIAQWRTGVTLEHTPRFSSQLSYYDFDLFNSRLLLAGLDYTLSRKYRINAQQTFDLGDNGTQTLSLSLDRRLPQWTLRLSTSFNELDDEQRIGFTFIPHGGSRDPRVF